MARNGRHGYVSTLEQLRERCTIDPVTRCWLWTGATSRNSPRLHSWDYAKGEKRAMPGTRAVWGIAHAEEPPRYVFRGCHTALCLNPAHLRRASTRAELGRHLALSGKLKGTHLEARRACQKLAVVAAGIRVTPPEVVRAMRAAPPEVTHRALARQYGVSAQAVSAIRRGIRHRDVAP